MHILHIAPYYAPAYAFGGVSRAVEGMARALVLRGHTVTVLTTDAYTHTERNPTPEETLDGVHIIRARNLSVWLRGSANLSTPPGMRTHIKQLIDKIDVIHCHEFRTVENLLVASVAAHHHTPLVLSPHGTLPQGTGRSLLKTAWDVLISPRLARQFDLVIGLAEPEVQDAKMLWRRWGASSQFARIPNGIHLAEFANLPDATAFRADYGLGDANIILFMGRLHPRKGADVLARAFTRLNRPDVRLVIVGPDEGLHKTLASIAANDTRLVLTGYLDGEQRLAALAAADVFALPAVGEGLPMSVLEAMAAGVPVLISEGCNLPEVAQQGAGREVTVDENAIAEALASMLTDEGARQQMAQAAQKLVQEQFTWGGVAAQLEQVYAQVKS